MSQAAIAAEILDRGHKMLERTLSDFTDAEMLVRPCDHANHAEWMLGHLCRSESGMIGMIGVKTDDLLPPGFADNYKQTKEHENDVAAPLGKAKLLELFGNVRSRTIEFVKTLSDADLLREIPSPFSKGSNTTVGFMLQMPSLHASTHVGQMQVIRRKLGKPILF